MNILVLGEVPGIRSGLSRITTAIGSVLKENNKISYLGRNANRVQKVKENVLKNPEEFNIYTGIYSQYGKNPNTKYYGYVKDGIEKFLTDSVNGLIDIDINEKHLVPENQDVLSLSLIKHIVEKDKIELIIVVEDVWIMKEYLNSIELLGIPIVAYTMVDTDMYLSDISYLNRYTEVWIPDYGAKKLLEDNNISVPIQVVPFPVDTDVFKPLDEEKRIELRERFDIPKNAFVLLTIGRNIRRKNINSFIESFKELIKLESKNAPFYGIIKSTNENYSLREYINITLGKEYSDRIKLILDEPVDGEEDEFINELYNMSDININLASGEGFCITSDSPILTEHGFKYASDIHEGESIYTPGGMRKVLSVSEVNKLKDFDVYGLLTATGELIKTTKEHEILTKNGMKTMEEIHKIIRKGRNVYVGCMNAKTLEIDYETEDLNTIRVAGNLQHYRELNKVMFLDRAKTGGINKELCGHIGSALVNGITVYNTRNGHGIYLFEKQPSQIMNDRDSERLYNELGGINITDRVRSIGNTILSRTRKDYQGRNRFFNSIEKAIQQMRHSMIHIDACHAYEIAFYLKPTDNPVRVVRQYTKSDYNLLDDPSSFWFKRRQTYVNDAKLYTDKTKARARIDQYTDISAEDMYIKDNFIYSRVVKIDKWNSSKSKLLNILVDGNHLMNICGIPVTNCMPLAEGCAAGIVNISTNFASPKHWGFEILNFIEPSSYSIDTSLGVRRSHVSTNDIVEKIISLYEIITGDLKIDYMKNESILFAERNLSLNLFRNNITSLISKFDKEETKLDLTKIMIDRMHPLSFVSNGKRILDYKPNIIWKPIEHTNKQYTSCMSLIYQNMINSLDDDTIYAILDPRYQIRDSVLINLYNEYNSSPVMARIKTTKEETGIFGIDNLGVLNRDPDYVSLTCLVGSGKSIKSLELTKYKTDSKIIFNNKERNIAISKDVLLDGRSLEMDQINLIDDLGTYYCEKNNKLKYIIPGHDSSTVVLSSGIIEGTAQRNGLTTLVRENLSWLYQSSGMPLQSIHDLIKIMDKDNASFITIPDAFGSTISWKFKELIQSKIASIADEIETVILVDNSSKVKESVKAKTVIACRKIDTTIPGNKYIEIFSPEDIKSLFPHAKISTV